MMSDIQVAQLATIVTSITTLLTLVGTSVWQSYTQARNRRWDQEDRERARAQQQLEAAARSSVTVAKIDENTQISREAFHGANGAKELIQQQAAHWQAKFDQLSTLMAETRLRVQHITRRGDAPPDPPAHRRAED